MKTQKDRTFTRTIQIYQWSKPSYPVEWAYGPDAVPEIDPSRGANPYALHSETALTYDQIQAGLVEELNVLEKWRVKASVDESRKLLWHIDQMKYFLAETTPKNEVDVLRGVSALKGDKASPLSQTVYESPLHVEQGLRFPLLIKVANYPRLVRASVEPQQEPRRDAKNLKKFKKQRACEAIADLHGEADNDQLKARIVEVAESFSPLDPFDIHADTLEGWRHAAAEMNFLLCLLKIDDDLKAASKRERDDESFYVWQLSEWLNELQEKGDPFAATFRRSLDEFAPLTERSREAEREQGVAVPFARFEKSFTKEECRKTISAILWRLFAGRTVNKLSPKHIDPMEHVGHTVACGAWGWAYLELWDAFSDKHIKRCENVNCKRLFIATKSNAEACTARWDCQKAVQRAKHEREKDVQNLSS